MNTASPKCNEGVASGRNTPYRITGIIYGTNWVLIVTILLGNLQIEPCVEYLIETVFMECHFFRDTGLIRFPDINCNTYSHISFDAEIIRFSCGNPNTCSHNLPDPGLIERLDRMR